MFRKTGASRLTAAFLTAALLAQTIFVIPAFASAKSNQYDRKLQLVTEKLYEDKETVDAVKALDKAVAIISVSDGKSRAKSFSATTGSLSASLEKVSEKAKASGITPKWLKLEVVTAVEQTKYSDFTAEVMGKRGGSFRRGISFNDYFGRVITESELNANGLIDYETGKLKLTEVNSFLKFLGKKQLDKIPSTLYIFDTASYFTENTAYAEKLTLKLDLSKYSGKEYKVLVYRNNKVEELSIDQKLIASKEIEDLVPFAVLTKKSALSQAATDIKNKVNKTVDKVKTGDTSDLLLWVEILIVAGAASAGILYWRKKKAN